ncbi:MAG: carbon dioxide concentrating mechanism protein [Microcystaceae cyanobacterium]
MPLPPIPMVSQSDYFVSGDVSIHETAVIAPGVILRAAANSQIVIGAGVCIGLGSVLNAYGGAIALEEGVTLGAKVLMIGRCTVGEGACIGQTSTLINTSIDPLSLIPSGTLLGDRSRTEPTQSPPPQAETEAIPSPWDNEAISPAPAPPKVSPAPEEESTRITEALETVPPTPVEEKVETVNPVEWVATSETVNKSPEPVIGQVYINQLLVTLFPERQSLQRSL